MAHLLPKFKDYFPKFLRNDTITTSEHLVSFSNDFHNIGVNYNYKFMNLFLNSLKVKVVTNCFELLPKILSIWEEFVYWFKSMYGKPKIPVDPLKEYNNITYKNGETIKSFNLCFTKLYNQIPKLIHP